MKREKEREQQAELVRNISAAVAAGTMPASAL